MKAFQKQISSIFETIGLLFTGFDNTYINSKPERQEKPYQVFNKTFMSTDPFRRVSTLFDYSG